jgi:predicted RNA-binding Zn ribbon-like protein
MVTKARAAALDRPAARMKRVGGQLCLDFTNTVGGWNAVGSEPRFSVRDERLGEYGDLVAWAVGAGPLAEAEGAALLREAQRRPSEAAAVLGRARRLREALYRTGWRLAHGRAPAREDVATVEQEIRAARQQEQLSASAQGLAWSLQRQPGALDLPLWPVALSAEAYLTQGDLTRLRACPGDECGWLFDDASRNRSRQWCDMRDCGNVAKVRSYRLRSKG